MADNAAPASKPTVASLAKQLEELEPNIMAAIGGVERITKQVVDAREGLPQQRLDHFLARLEKVEQNTKGLTHDWGPAIETLEAGQKSLLENLEAVSARIGRAEEVTAPEQGGLLDDVWGALEALRESVDRRLAAVPQSVSATVYTNGAPPVGGVGAKVLALMQAVEFIGKNRKADIEGKSGQDFSYMFRGIDDAQDAVGTAMRQVGLILKTEVVETDYRLTPIERKFSNGGIQTTLWSTCILTMRYIFVDPVDMSEFPFEMTGEGKDQSDKAASKAASMACKYGLFQALMIPVKGMVESDEDNPEITGETEAPAQPAAPRQETPAPAPQQPPAQPAPAAVSEETRRTRAAAAVEAAKVLHRMPSAADAMTKLESISVQVKKENLGDVVIGDLPVSEWLNSVWKVLKGLLSAEGRGTDQGATRADVDPGAPAATRAQQDREATAQRPQDPAPAPPEPSDDPWGDYTPPGEQF